MSRSLPRWGGSYWLHNEDSANPPVVWDAFKAVMRWECISAIKSERVAHNAEILRIQEHEEECADRHASDPSDTKYLSLVEARRLLFFNFSDLAHIEATHRANSVFLEGDKNGKLLSRLVAVDNQIANIPVIRGKSGELVTDPVDILREFCDFFEGLYAPIQQSDPDSLDTLLDELTLPRLSDEDRVMLDAGIINQEIVAAIFDFPPNKAPGPDGIPADFYKRNAEELAPRLSTLLAQCLKINRLPTSMLDVYMVLLPKPGKDPLECASYRPIALLNMDLKILTKILANRLVTVISSLVDIDQTGFMPGKSTDTNSSSASRV